MEIPPRLSDVDAQLARCALLIITVNSEFADCLGGVTGAQGASVHDGKRELAIPTEDPTGLELNAVDVDGCAR